MMLEYAKVLLQHLWKNITLLLVFNIIVFQLFAQNDGMDLLSNDDDQLMPILAIFALQNFVYAMWLQWSVHQRNFWKQITTSEPHLQGLHFGLFFVVSVFTQLIPVMVFMGLQSDPVVRITPLDYVSFIYVWSLSLLAYGAGVVVSWWRKWSLMAVILLLPFFWDVIFTNLYTQMVSLLVIALAMISFVFFKEQQRTLLVSVVLSFALYEMIVLFTKGVLVDRENIFSVPEKIIEQVDEPKDVEMIYRSHIPLSDYPGIQTLVDDTNGSVDWVTRELQIPDVLLSDLRIKQKLESGVKALWKQHPWQRPRLDLLNRDQLTLFFKNGVYISDASGNWKAIWVGAQDEQIVWYEMLGDTMAHDYNYGELFSNTDILLLALHDRILVFAGSDSYGLSQTIELSAPVLVAEQQKVSDSGRQYHRLMFLTADDNFQLYQAEEGTDRFVLSEKINTGKNLKRLLWGLDISELSIISAGHTQMRLFSWRAINPDVLFNINPWVVLSQFAALLICIFWYRKENAPLLVLKSLLVALFSWPMLIVLMYTMPRKASGLMELTPPPAAA